MKMLYNYTQSNFPPLGVSLTYTEEFKEAFSVPYARATIIGQGYRDCDKYNKTTKRCDYWKEVCGSEGKEMVDDNKRAHCMFREENIPIWRRVEKEK